MSTGYPGYDSVIGEDSATIGEILKKTAMPRLVRQESHTTNPPILQRRPDLLTNAERGMGFLPNQRWHSRFSLRDLADGGAIFSDNRVIARVAGGHFSDDTEAAE